MKLFSDNTIISRAAPLILLAALSYGTPAHAKAQSPITKNSETVDVPKEAWREPGFRVGLAYEFNTLLSLGYSANTMTQGFSVRPHYRFENDWGLGVTLSYGVPIKNQTGLRWALTLEGTWWFFEQLGVSVGAGYAGRMVQCDYSQADCIRNINYNGTPQEDSWLNEGDELNKCNGGGPTLSTRIEYHLVVNDYFGSGPYLQTYFESIRCEEEAGPLHPSTGQTLYFFDRWSYLGASAGWWFTWR